MGRKALDLPGDTREDLWITVELAKRLGLKWNYKHPSEVFAEMKEPAMPSRQHHLGVLAGILHHVSLPGTWIIRAKASFGNGFPTKTGRARLVPADVLPPAEQRAG